VCDASWPQWKEEHLQSDSISYPVQFNGKMRFQLEVPSGFSPQEVEAALLASEQTAKYLEGKTPKKVIVVPGRIINVVL